jgi:hypothetical protein
MSGDDDKRGEDGRKAIFTGDDLPPEAGIAAATEPLPPRWEDADDDFEAEAAQARGLGLDDDERLPWLESADDIDADEGFDGGRVIGFVLLGMVALAMIVGAVWFATNRGGPGPADGSLIRAEKGPYKVAPDDPGGKTFAGTGDTSYAVAQGENRSGSVAAPSPSPTPQAAATAAPRPASSPAPSGGGVGVQVGAYTSATDAEAGWSALSGRHEALKGVSHRVVEGQADFGRVFRLQAVAGDLAAANALCATLKAAGQGCQVKR